MQFNKIKNLLNPRPRRAFSAGRTPYGYFGSIARNEATENSDVDILVDFDSKKGLFGFVDLNYTWKNILECHVDLVTKRVLHRPKNENSQ